MEKLQESELSDKESIPEQQTIIEAASFTDRDWRARGVVTAVKNQGSCGSCYAFSAICTLESALAIKTGKLTRLSEQSVVDCSTKGGNLGCRGGSLYNTFRYFMANAVALENSYPYNGKLGQCKITGNRNQGQISSFVRIRKGDETQLTNSISNVGPVSLSIDARLDTLRFYKSGIYNDNRCSSTALNHGVTAVGVKSGPVPFYIIKNSWGPNWGEGGYFRLVQNQNNRCGVASDAIYPMK
ncbi:hypothetical protein HZS_4494 [Henneguya salminicola]|nr:hypothetical protein HZS_4494 [Henneguya salminicola]